MNTYYVFFVLSVLSTKPSIFCPVTFSGHAGGGQEKVCRTKKSENLKFICNAGSRVQEDEKPCRLVPFPFA